MNIEATPRNAALTGAWTALGMVTFEAWEAGHKLDVMTHNVIFVTLSVIFFIGPVLLFVIGRQNIRFDLAYPFSREYWAEFPKVMLRMLCWFLGAAAFGFPYSYFLSSITPI